MIEQCDGHDHRFETYAAADRRLLALVESFSRRLADAADGGADLTKVLAALDPDPARYTWVDEGGGLVEDVLAAAEEQLAAAPRLAGFRRLPSRILPAARPAARPAVAVAPDGRTLVAWIEWAEHVGEQVLAVMLDQAGQPLSEPQPVSGPFADCLRPSVAFDGDGLGWVFFGLARDGAVGVWCARQSGAGFGPPGLLSTTRHPSFNQEVICHADGALECCWQGYDDGRFRVFSRRQGPRGFADTRLVSSDADRNVWDPAIAADGAGRTCYAWTTYGESGYPTVLVAGDGARRGPRLLLSAPRGYSLHPSVAFTPDGALWCAYDAVALAGHGGSGPTRLRARAEMAARPAAAARPPGRAVPGDLAPDVTAEVVVVRLDDPAGPAASNGPVGTGVHVSPAGLPRLVTTADGSVAVGYRCLRRLPLMRYFWEAVLEWLGPSGWGSLTTFDEPDGPLEELAVAPGGGAAVVAWQQDGRKRRQLAWSEGFGGEECLARREHYGEVIWHSLHTGGRILAGRAAPPPAGPGRPRVAAARPPAAAPPAANPRPGADSRPWVQARRAGAAARAGRGQRPSRYRTRVGDRDYQLYWGDLHRHSLISRCTAGDEPGLDDFYRYSFDVCEYDFWAVTDHAENTSQYQWWSIQKLADVLHVDGRFVPFYGFEWTAATGHQNVIYDSSRRGAPIYSSAAAETATPSALWAHLRRAGQRSITIPHHPGSAMVPFDWSFRADDLLRLVEVFQACRGSYEDDGCFRQYSDGTLAGTFVADGLRNGHRFGLISSSDHGNGASYVGAFAERLSRQSLFAALHDRRTIAATTRDIVIELRLNDCFMGTVAPPSPQARVAVSALGYRDIARLDIIRNGVAIHSLEPSLELGPREIAVPVRVEWSAGEISRTDWSGHLAVTGGRIRQTAYWSPEITDVAPDRIWWTAQTRNFRSQYGAQRGGVEVTLIGSPACAVQVTTAAGSGSATIGELAVSRRVELAQGAAGTLALQQATGGLASLGSNQAATTFTEPVVTPSWYYARVTLEDGEMAWSSPVWVNPA
jgi:Protein of unknown function (DUF3604)